MHEQKSIAGKHPVLTVGRRLFSRMLEVGTSTKDAANGGIQLPRANLIASIGVFLCIHSDSSVYIASFFFFSVFGEG